MNEGARAANEQSFQTTLLGLLRDILEEVRIMDSRLMVIEEQAQKELEAQRV